MYGDDTVAPSKHDVAPGDQDNSLASDDAGQIRHARAAARKALWRQYASDMALAQVCWQLGRLDRTVSLLERHRLSLCF